MPEQIRTEIEINAPALRVWEILTDFASYPQWNPFILEVKGVVSPGATVPYRFEFPRGGLRIWARAKILKFEPEKELRWAAHFLTPRVFNGEHYFAITSTSGSSSVFRHGEIFSGLTVPLVWPILRAKGPDAYESLNKALKQRAETSRS